jgi:hypothetical protein
MAGSGPTELGGVSVASPAGVCKGFSAVSGISTESVDKSVEKQPSSASDINETLGFETIA